MISVEGSEPRLRTKFRGGVDGARERKIRVIMYLHTIAVR